ncbi:MAG: hypothetical protein ACPGUV_05380 [Polyangiales bacterium]
MPAAERPPSHGDRPGRHFGWRLWLWLSGCTSLAACAPALPTMAGGTTTPVGRHALGAGAAGCFAFGETADLERDGAAAQSDPEGALPVFWWRHAPVRDWDVGVLVAASTARLDLRRQFVLQRGTTQTSVRLGLSPYAGWLPGLDRGHGGRGGLALPAVYAVDFGNIVEVWTGVQLAAEYRAGDFGAAVPALRAGIVDAQAIVGWAAGLGSLHFIFELSAGIGRWWLDAGAPQRRLHGFSLTPAGGVRWRF